MVDNPDVRIDIGVSLQRLSRQLAATEGRVAKTAAKMEKSFANSTGRMQKSFQNSTSRMALSVERMGSRASRVFGRIALAAAPVLGTREIVRAGDAWIEFGNKIAAAGQVAGLQGRSLSDLNDIATENRAGIQETVDLYTRLLRSSKGVAKSEEDVARATGIAIKAFKAGGASVQEFNAGVLQLGQALGSGFLQGDELRSLRENAPLLAQAIADEFDTTIGGLKALGAEGKLTSDRVFNAILEGQQKVENAFAATVPTVADGLRLIGNATTELIGSFSQGSGAGEGLASLLQGIAAGLQSGSADASRFGAQVATAMDVAGRAIKSLRDEINVGDGFDFSFVAERFRNGAKAIIVTMREIVAFASATGAAIGQALLATVVGVGDAANSVASRVVTAIENILNSIIDGVNQIRSQLLDFASLPGQFGALGRAFGSTNTLGRVDLRGNDPVQGPPTAQQAEREAFNRQGIYEVFLKEQSRVNAGLKELGRAVISAGDEIKNAGSEFTDPDANDPRGDQTAASLPVTETVTPTAQKGGGKDSKKTIFDDVNKEIANLRIQTQLIGLSERATVRLEAKLKLLNAAKERGLDLDQQVAGTGETLRQQIDRQAEALANMSEKYRLASEQADFYAQQQDNVKSGIVDAIVEGQNLSGVLEDLAKSFARAALQAALFNQGPFAQAGGSQGLLGSLFGGLFGGFRERGGPVQPGKAYVVGEKRPELFVPNVPGRIMPNVPQGGGMQEVHVVVESTEDLRVVATNAGRSEAVRVTQANNARIAQAQRRS